jgi:radical SAM superfamily enzyme YgiQ (UPF0313 family)
MRTLNHHVGRLDKGELLIVDPPWDIWNDRKNGVRASSRWPHEYAPGQPQCVLPFLMGYACSFLRAHGVKADLTTFSPPRVSYRWFFDEIIRREYEVILVATATQTFKSDLAFCDDLKARTDTLVALVGTYATANAEECIRHPSVDAVLKGEYEKNSLKLFQTRECRIYDYDLLEEIETLPFPVRRDAILGEILHRNGSFGTRASKQHQMWGSRGCPYRCSFCVWPPVMYNGANYRVRSADSIASEIDYLIRKEGGRDFAVWFDDDTFNIGERRMRDIADVFGSRGIEYCAMCRADTIRHRETLAYMRRNGFMGCCIGVESGCQELVDACNKKLDLDDVRRFMTWARELGIYVHMTFTFGLPGETNDTVDRTKRFIREMNPDSFQTSGCAPVKGTAYHDELKKKGLIDDETNLDGSLILQLGETK